MSHRVWSGLAPSLALVAAISFGLVTTTRAQGQTGVAATGKAATAEGQPVPHKALKALFPNKEVVLIQGWVSAEKDLGKTTFNGFYLRDRFGDLILIRTTKPLPDVNTEIRVRGVGLIDNETREPYVAEEARFVLKRLVDGQGRVIDTFVNLEGAGGATPPVPPPGGGTVGPTPEKKVPPTGTPEPPQTAAVTPAWYLTWPWLAGFAMAGLVLVGFAVMVANSKKKAAPELAVAGVGVGGWQPTGVTPSGSLDYMRPTQDFQAPPAAPQALSPAGPAFEEYKTVKAYKTSKVLPGRLIVMDGPRETDVIHLSDQSGHGEIEIGRDSPDMTGGIRIKDKTNTLSRRQAKLLFDSVKREFKVHNLVGDSGNPTGINGRAMHDGESVVLKDGDVLAMGSVELMFRQR